MNDKGMLELLVESPVPTSGPVTLIRENVPDHFSGIIIQHGGEFRLYGGRDGDDFRVTLDPLDALWVINTLGLHASCSPVFGRVVEWKLDHNP